MILVTRNTCSLIKDHDKEYMFIVTRILCFWRDWNVISCHERVTSNRFCCQCNLEWSPLLGSCVCCVSLSSGSGPRSWFCVFYMKFHPNDTTHGSDYHSWTQGLVIPCVLDWLFVDAKYLDRISIDKLKQNKKTQLASLENAFLLSWSLLQGTHVPWSRIATRNTWSLLQGPYVFGGIGMSSRAMNVTNVKKV